VLEADRERLLVSNHVTHKFDMERFNHEKLSKMEVMEHYQLSIFNNMQFGRTETTEGTYIRPGKICVGESIKFSAK
jgi:hypothetical protein